MGIIRHLQLSADCDGDAANRLDGSVEFLRGRSPHPITDALASDEEEKLVGKNCLNLACTRVENGI